MIGSFGDDKLLFVAEGIAGDSDDRSANISRYLTGLRNGVNAIHPRPQVDIHQNAVILLLFHHFKGRLTIFGYIQVVVFRHKKPDQFNVGVVVLHQQDDRFCLFCFFGSGWNRRSIHLDFSPGFITSPGYRKGDYKRGPLTGIAVHH